MVSIAYGFFRLRIRGIGFEERTNDAVPAGDHVLFETLVSAAVGYGMSDMITGKEAQQIGLVLKSVPREHLEGEVEQLADRLSRIDPDLLSANKRIINMGLELMGARTLQRLAAENDVRGHNTKAAAGYFESVQEIGLKETLRARDAKFGDGRARVNGPEIRDEKGYLIDPS